MNRSAESSKSRSDQCGRVVAPLDDGHVCLADALARIAQAVENIEVQLRRIAEDIMVLDTEASSLSARRIAVPLSTRGFGEEDRKALAAVKGLLEGFVTAAESRERVNPLNDWHSPAEVAALLSRAPFTVREWCRNGRINAQKRPTGRGDADEWEISADEVQRIKNHGLLPRLPQKLIRRPNGAASGRGDGSAAAFRPSGDPSTRQ